MNPCPICAVPVEPVSGGRPRRFCSTACRHEHHRRRRLGERRAFKLAADRHTWDLLGTEHHEFYRRAEAELAALIDKLRSAG